MLEDAAEPVSGARSGVGGFRAMSAGRAGSRSAARSAPRPIPLTSQLSVPVAPRRTPSQRCLSRQLSQPNPCLHRLSSLSDGELSEQDEDDSALLSTSSVFDGIDSPEVFMPRASLSDGETGSDCEAGGGYSEARSSQPASFSAPNSFDFTSFGGRFSGGMHFDRRHVKLVARGLSSSSVTSSMPLSVRRTAPLPPPSPGAPCVGLPAAAACFGGGMQSAGADLRGLSTSGSVPHLEEVWRTIAAEDAARLGAGLGNIRIAESPTVPSVAGSSISGVWDTVGWPGTPGSVGGKRKSCELSPEQLSLGCVHAAADGTPTPLRKLRAVTPQMSPASVMGFAGLEGALSPPGASSYDTQDTLPPQLTRPQTASSEPAAAVDGAAALQWKLSALDDMMQCVTAAEQRMLDISTMRVA